MSGKEGYNTGGVIYEQGQPGPVAYVAGGQTQGPYPVYPPDNQIELGGYQSGQIQGGGYPITIQGGQPHPIYNQGGQIQGINGQLGGNDPNYGNPQNVNPVINTNVYLQNQQILHPKQDERITVKYELNQEISQINCCVAFTVFIVNLFLPGIGTMIGACFIRNSIVSMEICCAGVIQLLTAVCLIGWCMALITSCAFLAVAGSDTGFEQHYYTKVKNVTTTTTTVNKQ